MNDAQQSMILTRGLTRDEEEKFDRLEIRISVIFNDAEQRITVFEGKGEGDSREICFVPEITGPPLISFPAAQFLADSDEEFLSRLQRRLDESSM